MAKRIWRSEIMADEKQGLWTRGSIPSFLFLFVRSRGLFSLIFANPNLTNSRASVRRHTPSSVPQVPPAPVSLLSIGARSSKELRHSSPNQNMEDGGSEAPWICGSCTYHNDASLSVCAMCSTHRSATTHGLSFFHRPLAAALSNTILRNLVADGHASLPFSLCTVPQFLAGAISGVLTGMFAVVGAFTGAVTGALAGRATNSGLLRGAGLGAAAGAVLSVEVLEASWSYWHSERTRFMRSSSVAEFIDDFLNGRFAHDRFSSPMLSMNSWQVNIAEVSYEDLYDMFGPGEGIVKGVPEACLKMLPCYTVTNDNKFDSCGENIWCAICLQELQGGETVRSLPSCHHVYHMDCIDVWLFRQGSCPICRQRVEGKL